MWVALACLATAPSLIVGLTNHSLSGAGVSLGLREAAGALLAVVLLASLGALLVGARKLIEAERRLVIGRRRAQVISRLLLAIATGALAVALVAIVVSRSGLEGTISHAWKSFTATRTASNYDPSRLLSTDSENRWVLWKEAAGAFSDRPLGGWGAGSFGVVHLLYRRDTTSVQQPHSVPLQFLAETGIVGTALAFGALALLLLAGLRAVRQPRAGRSRLLAAALLGGAVAYVLHTFYDWAWDIPAVTLPALVFLGVLAASASPPARRTGLSSRASGSGAGAIGLGLVSLFLCVYVLSSTLPSVAQTKADSALVAAADPSPDTLLRAQASAALASSVDPLSDAGLRAEAAIAIHRGQFAQARDYLLQAVARDPSDVQAWGQLVSADSFLDDMSGLRQAAQRVIALDPRGREVSATIGELNLIEAPAAASATAIATPR